MARFRPTLPTVPGAPPDPTDPNDPSSPDYKIDPSPKATKETPAAPIDLTNDIVPNPATPGSNVEPPYDPANPDPWIVYNYKIGNNGASPDASQLDYWHKKLASGEITGAGVPADYNYWGTRLRRQGVDDLNPQSASAPRGGYLDAANQFGGLFGNGGYSGFLGGSMVPTDAGAFDTLQQRIKDILGGGGGLNSRPSSSVIDNATGGGNAAGGGSSAAPVGAPATSAAANANPAAPAYGTPGPNAPVPPVTYGGSGNPDTKARDAGILGDLLGNKSNPGNPLSDQIANAGATRIPDRAADAIASMFGLSPILKAGEQLQRFNRPGDINPDAGPQLGPTDPNLKPTTPDEQQRNAAIVAALLAQNEANGGR